MNKSTKMCTDLFGKKGEELCKEENKELCFPSQQMEKLNISVAFSSHIS